MKRILIGMPAVLALAFASAVLREPQVAAAQDGQQKGWLEGMVRNEEGEPVHVWIVPARDGRRGDLVGSDGDMRQAYSIRDMAPGVYEINVSVANPYRPQRIFGVVIKPGVRSILNITLDKGSGIKEIGQPTVATQPVVIISQELARLQTEIDALKAK